MIRCSKIMSFVCCNYDPDRGKGSRKLKTEVKIKDGLLLFHFCAFFIVFPFNILAYITF